MDHENTLFLPVARSGIPVSQAFSYYMKLEVLWGYLTYTAQRTDAAQHNRHLL